MRISDWSSDVCSSDLGRHQRRRRSLIAHAPPCQGRGSVAGQAFAALRLPTVPLGASSHRHDGHGWLAELLIVIEKGRASICGDRKGGVWGKRVSVRVNYGGRRLIKKKKVTRRL